MLLTGFSRVARGRPFSERNQSTHPIGPLEFSYLHGVPKVSLTCGADALRSAFNSPSSIDDAPLIYKAGTADSRYAVSRE